MLSVRFARHVMSWALMGQFTVLFGQMRLSVSSLPQVAFRGVD